MAKHSGVIFKFDKTTDVLWLGMFGEYIKFDTQKDVGDIVIASMHVKEYSLADHQFILLKVDVGGKEVALLLPRKLVAAIVEGPNLDKLGFVEK
jgi:hypothetical protein